MAHDLPNGVELQTGALDMFRPLRLDIGAEAAEDGLIESREVVARNRLARRNGDVPPVWARRRATDGSPSRSERRWRSPRSRTPFTSGSCSPGSVSGAVM